MSKATSVRSAGAKLLLAVVACAALILAAYFLTSPGGHDLYPVEGTVVVARSPNALTRCTHGRVWLHPDGSRGNQCSLTPMADLRNDGTYRVYTDGRPGAPPGWYRVTVLAVGLGDKTSKRNAKQMILIPAKYTELESSDLVFEVTPDVQPGRYDLVLR
jgi:hypothetical protein